MRDLLAALFLLILLGLFSTGLQKRLRLLLQRTPAAVFLVPAALTVFSTVALVHCGASAAVVLPLAATYTFPPAMLVYRRRPWLDFAAILFLWLPIEFGAGTQWLPHEAWPVANVLARGSAITLALVLFLLFRGFEGMKYNLPRRWSDLFYPTMGFAVAAPVLIALGLRLGYMGPFRGFADFGAGAFAFLWLKILAAVAIPEELLFRALIQNWLMQRFGFTHRTLLAASLIFGAAHLDNPPGPLPNWRYMLLATIAGGVFGKVFWKSSTILSSASLHALVNCVRHVFFG
jgi:membrane protease YdiL (CAAX protease family)